MRRILAAFSLCLSFAGVAQTGPSTVRCTLEWEDQDNPAFVFSFGPNGAVSAKLEQGTRVSALAVTSRQVGNERRLGLRYEGGRLVFVFTPEISDPKNAGKAVPVTVDTVFEGEEDSEEAACIPSKA